MTVAKPATEYVSGFCGVRAHDRCRGTYAGCACHCECHQEPEPEPVLPPHCAGVASVGYAGKLAQAVCSCGWAAPERRRRNHDAFDDARQHLAETAQPDAA
jgi:hypothetical protein